MSELIRNIMVWFSSPVWDLCRASIGRGQNEGPAVNLDMA